MPASSKKIRCAILSAMKHEYVQLGMAKHPRFELAVVADDPQIADWAHARNQKFADSQKIPYVRDVERALGEFDVQVAIVNSEAERHCDLSVRAAMAGKHIVQDKPLTTKRSEADRLVAAVEKNRVKFMMWNRSFLPALVEAKEQVDAGAIGLLRAIHVDFYFAKDAGPPKGTRKPGDTIRDWKTHQIAANVDGSDGGLGQQPMGELAVEGIYPLGYIRVLTKSEIRRVYARSTAHFHQVNVDNDIEDLASVTLELDDGIIGSLAIGRIGAASHASGGEIKVRLLGTDGALVVREASPDVGIYYRNQVARDPRQKRIASDADFILAESFAQAIENGGDVFPNARGAHAIFATVEAALASARSGQPVEVKHWAG